MIDVLINNAGVGGPHGDPGDLTAADARGSGRFIDRTGPMDWS